MSQKSRNRMDDGSSSSIGNGSIHDEHDFDRMVSRITELELIIAEEEEKIRNYFTRKRDGDSTQSTTNSSCGVN